MFYALSDCVGRPVWHNQLRRWESGSRPMASHDATQGEIMRKQLRFTPALVALLGLALMGISLATAAQGDKIKVLIIDGQNNHQWQQTTPVMKKELENTGRFTVDVSTSDKADSKKPADWGERMKPVPFP